MGVKRKHIASIRKCNDILTSAIFECDTIGWYCSKYNNIINGKKPLYDQTGQKGDWALLQQRSIIRLSLDSPRTFQSQKWENTST